MCIGQDNGLFHFEGSRYKPASDSWLPTPTMNIPAACGLHSALWTGSEMVLWGGDMNWIPSGGRYNPTSDSWRSTSLVNAPFVRGGGRWSTVWTGTQMIVWGGVIDTQRGNLYCASGQPNIAPVATDDAYNVAAGKPTTVGNLPGVLANDSDANGDPLTALLITKTAHGTLKFNSNGSFTYTPAAGFVGADSFTYRANDGVAGSNTATANITVR